MSLVVGSITFGMDGGVAIDYFDTVRDAKQGVMVQHSIIVGPEAMTDELAELESAAQRALSELLVRLVDLPAVEVEDDDDDEPGYDNPNERDRVRE